MGDPRRISKKYSTPGMLWTEERITAEKALMERYGLAKHQEIWKAQAILRNKRQNARKLLGLTIEQRTQREGELIASLQRMGLVQKNATLDDILGLQVDMLLERRLQSIVWRKGLALTPKQARQFIVHGLISVNGKRMSIPSYVVPVEDENSIRFYGTPIELNIKPKEKTKKEFKEIEQALKEQGVETTRAETEPVDESVAEEMEKEAREEITE